MKPEITKIIEQYLQNELSAEDRAAFLLELNTDADLLREVALQQTVHEGAKRLAQRAIVVRTARRYHFYKTLMTTGLIVFCAAALTVTAILANRFFEKPQEQPQLDSEQLVQLISRIEQELPLDGAPAEYFNLSQTDTVVLSESGVLLSVPEGAFMTGGKVYEGPKVIQWQEAFDAATIVKCGLSTMAGDHLLETQGMFGLQAYTPQGKQLDINPKVGVYIQIPVAEHKKGMMLFEGKKGKSGIIDWQNPQPLEKLPVMADMSELDFYPPGYEAHLDGLKWKTGKKDRDSLYLSFEEEGVVGQRFIGLSAQGGVANDELESSAPLVAVPGYAAREYGYGTDEGIPDTMYNNIVLDTYGASTDVMDKVSWSYSIEQKDASHGEIVLKAVLKPGWRVFSADQGWAEGDVVGYPTEIQVRPSGNFRLDGRLYDVGNKQIGTEGEFSYARYFMDKAEFRQPFTVLKEGPFPVMFDVCFQVCGNGSCLEPSSVGFPAIVQGYRPEKSSHIPPSKVLAFWKKEFNNTILATRDFERRMQSIHGTCSEEVLDLYTDNLNKPLHEIDAMAAKLGHDEFNAFAEERVGGVQLDNPHINNMRRFYASAAAQLKKEAKQDRNFVRRQEAKWDAELGTVRRKENRDHTKRQQNAAAQEQRFNRESIARQFASNTVSVTIYRNAPANLYNLDRYAPFRRPVATPSTRPQEVRNEQKPAMQAERKSDGSVQYTREVRKSVSATEYSVTVQQATIRYNDLTLEVGDPKQYGRLMLYLFPRELNSFVRVDPAGGKFSQRLNDEMTYDIAVVGIAEDGYFIYERSGLNKGALGTVELAAVSETEFNSRIEALNRNRGVKPQPVSLELNWLMKEKKNYAVQRLRQENAEFRNRLLPKVFPCAGEEYAAPAVDEISVDLMPEDLQDGTVFDEPKAAQESAAGRQGEMTGGFAQSAQFPGGSKAMQRYIRDSIRFPEAAKNRYINGTCNVQFNISADGTLENLRVTRNVTNCPECDEEALRVIASMPPWKPAERNGRPVWDIFTIPIAFTMDGSAELVGEWP